MIFLSPIPKQSAYLNQDMIYEQTVITNSKYLTLYRIISTIIISNNRRRYIAWMEMNLDQFEWNYEIPFGAHFNYKNWCPTFLSLWIEEKVDDPSKVSNRIFLLMSEMKFSMHGSPRYNNTLITARRYVIIQVHLLLSPCHLSAYTQSVLYIPRQELNRGFCDTFVTGDILISYAIFNI